MQPEEEVSGLGGLEASFAQLMNQISPEDLQKMAESVKGIDLRSVLGAFGGGLPGGAPGGTPGGDPPGPGPSAALPLPRLSLAAFLPAPRLDLGGSLTGISELVGYFTANPLRGRKWSFKDVGGLIKLFGSPNVQSLVGTARAAPGLIKAGKQLAPLVAALREGGKAKGRGGRASGAGSAGAAPAGTPESPVPSPDAAPTEPPKVRFHLSGGPPPVLEPWRG